MSKYRFVHDKQGIGELLKSEWALEICSTKANEIKARLGEGYEVQPYPNGKSRVNVSVYADSDDAMTEALERNTIIKATY